MALSRIKTWGAEVLLFTDLNAEFDNLINNAMTLLSPWTTNMAAGGYRLTGLGLGAAASPSLQFTGDTDTGIFSSGANTLDLATAGTSWLTLSSVGILTANGTTGALRLHNLTTAQRDALTPAAGMLVYNTSTSAINVYTSSWGAIGGAGAVSSVSNADGTLTISPTTGAVVASLALGHANTWTANQTFSNIIFNSGTATSGVLSCATGLVRLEANAVNASVAIAANGTGNLLLLDINANVGSGQKVIAISNATTAPSTNPTGGGVLYVQSGALKYRGSSGTMTTIAPA